MKRSWMIIIVLIVFCHVYFKSYITPSKSLEIKQIDDIDKVSRDLVIDKHPVVINVRVATDLFSFVKRCFGGYFLTKIESSRSSECNKYASTFIKAKDEVVDILIRHPGFANDVINMKLYRDTMLIIPLKWKWTIQNKNDRVEIVGTHNICSWIYEKI